MTNEELNKWLADEIGVYPGCCSSIECVKYDIASETAIKMQGRMIEKAVEWLENNATDHLGFNSISETFSLSWDFIDLFKQAMEEDL